MLEYLSGIKGKLPASVTPTLGPDATGLGWVYQYALEDTTGRLSLARAPERAGLVSPLRAHRGARRVRGRSVGGFEKQYQVDLDPAKLLALRHPDHAR